MKQKGYEDNVIEEATGFNENVSEEVLAARVIYRTSSTRGSRSRRTRNTTA